MKVNDYIKKTVKFGFEPTLQELEQAIEKEGFNIVSEIKIHDRLKEEFHIDFRKFIIIRARHTDFQNNFPGLGTEDNFSKMQCNFVIYQNSGNETEVVCYNPVALNGNSNNADWKETEKQIVRKINKVILRF
ncbi:MAG: DUF302 domain-containing protein [Tangfeifania sp.]